MSFAARFCPLLGVILTAVTRRTLENDTMQHSDSLAHDMSKNCLVQTRGTRNFLMSEIAKAYAIHVGYLASPSAALNVGSPLNDHLEGNYRYICYCL